MSIYTITYFFILLNKKIIKFFLLHKQDTFQHNFTLQKHKENRLTENEMLNLMFISDVRDQVFKMLEEEGFECIIFSPESNIHSSVIKVFW